MALILNGRTVRAEIEQKLKAQIITLLTPPRLAIIQVGNRADSSSYIAEKKKCAERIGAEVIIFNFDDSVKTEDLIFNIKNLNQDTAINGIILQLPIPSHIDLQGVIESITPEKDVDGLTSTNLKLLWTNKPSAFVPATAKGILSLLDYYKIPLAGKKVTIVGRSILVGKPVILTMLNRDATVTICHSGTSNLKEETSRADVLIVAIGKPSMIDRGHVLPHQVVIDVGINLVSGQILNEEIEGYKFVGDVDFENVKDIVSAVSPVPGGVGPMTVVSLFENLLQARKLQQKD